MGVGGCVLYALAWAAGARKSQLEIKFKIDGILKKCHRPFASKIWRAGAWGEDAEKTNV